MLARGSVAVVNWQLEIGSCKLVVGKCAGLENAMEKQKNVFIAPGAIVLGQVTLGEDVGIWYHATVRGDRAPISIGRGSNVQDNSVIHVDDNHPVTIGENVTIGHGCIIHGCEIGDNSLIGMGSIIMNGAVIGRNCIVGAGALVTQNRRVPDNSLLLGNPAIIKREVTPEEIAANLHNAGLYVEEARACRETGSC